MSSLGWIDFSSEHRDRVRTVIDLLSTPGVVDELGIGVIRDSFADRMFPGLSTIQTRAKYFTLTAILLRDYQRVERAKRHPRTLERYLEEEERECRIALVEAHGGGSQGLGIIGGTFGFDRKRDVMRKPASIYWNGLRRFGFVSPPHLSLAEFGRRLSDEGRQLRSLLAASRDERGDDLDAEDGCGLVRVTAPEIDDDYWDPLSIDLTPAEAGFLRRQIQAHQPDSLLGQILLDDARMEEVLMLSPEAGFAEFSELPFVRSLGGVELRRTVGHARDFWTILEGAHIRYNCLLQDSGFGTPELRKRFEAMWEDWRKRIADFPEDWETAFMWNLVSTHGSRITDSTRAFIGGWIGEARAGAPSRSRCDELVTRQERRNKGNRARLLPENNEPVRSWVGLDRLAYRLPVVMQMIRDIRDGELGKGGADA